MDALSYADEKTSVLLALLRQFGGLLQSSPDSYVPDQTAFGSLSGRTSSNCHQAVMGREHRLAKIASCR